MKVNALFAMSLLFSAGAAADPLELTEAELDAVTAGSGGEPAGEVAAVHATRRTGRGNVVEAEGTLEVLRAGDRNLLMLRDNAQQNLGALINVNAAGAPVNVLLNLNVNINSEVGSMRQINVNGTPGNMTVRPGGGG